jgi:hypothetical protein
MKEVTLRILNLCWDNSPLKIIYSSLPNILHRLIIAFQLWCLNLSLYFTMLVTVLFFCILTGEGGFITGSLEFTKAYFYNGYFLGFLAWRIHLSYFLFCILTTIREY